MIEAVIFDMDGLLIDSEVVTFQYYQEICKKHGRVLDEEYYKTLLGTNAAYIKQELGTYLQNEELAVRVINEVHGFLEKHFEKQGVPLKPGARELVTDLRNRRVKMAVATSSSRVRAIPLLEKTGLLEAFDVVVCGDEVEHSKPHPEIFIKAAKALKKTPSQILVLEDSENGIIAAHTGGMRCINVPDLKAPSEKVIAKADDIVNNLLEVRELLDKI